MEKKILAAALLAATLVLGGCDKTPATPEQPGAQPEQPDTPDKPDTPEKPEEPEQPSEDASLDENDCIIFNDDILERAVLSYKTPIDTDGDGKISLAEAQAVTELDLGFEQPQESGRNLIGNISALRYFTSLEVLNLRYHKVKDATPIESLSKLNTLILIGNPISKLDTSKLSELSILRLSDTDIKEINIANTPKLTQLYLSRTRVGSVDLSKLPLLEETVLNECPNLTELHADGLKNVTRIDAVASGIVKASFTDCPLLSQIHIDSNELESIELSKLPLLIVLNIYGNKLSSLDVTELPYLLRLYVHENNISKLDLAQNLYLRELMASGNPIEEVDLSHNEEITHVELQNMPKLKVINLKNLAFDQYDSSYLIASGNTALQKVITDPGAEFEYVKEIFKDNPNVTVTTQL